MDGVAGLVAVPVAGLVAVEVVTGAATGAVAFGAAVVAVVAVGPAAEPGEVVGGRGSELAAAVE